MPETDLSGAAEGVRGNTPSLRPYSHSRLAHIFEVTVGPKLPEGQLDVIITQRAGSSGMTLSNMEKLVSAIKAKQAKLVYDLDETICWRDIPIPGDGSRTRKGKTKIRFLFREADMVTVSTPLLTQQLVAVQSEHRILTKFTRRGSQFRNWTPQREEQTSVMFGTQTHIYRT